MSKVGIGTGGGGGGRTVKHSHGSATLVRTRRGILGGSVEDAGKQPGFPSILIISRSGILVTLYNKVHHIPNSAVGEIFLSLILNKTDICSLCYTEIISRPSQVLF